ncbi:Secreted peptide, partial [Phytophthora megakarya]
LAEEYGAVSGLRLNDIKTLVVPLSELTWSHHKRPEPMLPDGLAAMSPGDFARYLGIQAGPGIAAEESWTIAVKQLRTRLNLAMRKTLTVERGDDCGGDSVAAIIILKLLYIGRHAWPKPVTVVRVEKHIKNYVWHGAFALEITGTRAWLNGDVASLPITEGGISIPNLRTELMAMAADAVTKWAVNGSFAAHIAGDLLFGKKSDTIAAGVFITPGTSGDARSGARYGATLWTTGRQLIEREGGQLHYGTRDC